MQHPNARLTPRGRLELVLLVERGASLRQAPVACNVALSTAHRWARRWRVAAVSDRASLACLLDRSSRPHSRPRLVAADVELRVVEARAQTGARPRPRLPPVTRAMEGVFSGVIGAACPRFLAGKRDVSIHGSVIPGCDSQADAYLWVDPSQLADFVRHRRESLQPEDVGVPRGLRRRTSGLRREEVARLAAMSTDYYARLEQQRGPQPSPPMLASIARALRLTLAERDHLYRLAGHTPPRRDVRSDHISPGLQRVLDCLDTPAMITNDLGEVLAQNPLAVALLGDETRFAPEGLERSRHYRWFTNPAERALHAPEAWLRANTHMPSEMKTLSKSSSTWSDGLVLLVTR